MFHDRLVGRPARHLEITLQNRCHAAVSPGAEDAGLTPTTRLKPAIEWLAIDYFGQLATIRCR
jgi:hypothetical protein